MKTVSDWGLCDQSENGVDLTIDRRHLMLVRVLEDTLIRVSFLRDGAWRLGRTWCVAPGGDAPWEGRSRDDQSGFACPAADITLGDDLTIETARLRLVITRPLHLTWFARIDGQWVEFVQERPTGGVMLGANDCRHGHFLRRFPTDKVYGLGEKTGDLERSRRRFEMRNLDAMGYDAETTDPLYKHVPFTMTQTPTAGAWSIFYDNLAPCWFDLGCELDNYHLPYRSYRAEDGDLDYYVRWAPEMLELVKGQVRLTGGTAFPPRWTLGYSGSTMSYTDADDAQARLEGFLAKLEEHNLPCDSFQMSSGYTSIGMKRYVFNWNRKKVPDIDAMTARFARAGVNLVANIKPCLLQDHPLYASAAEGKLFVRDSEDLTQPERSSFWDDVGSHLDFTNPATIAWWKNGVTTQLLVHNITSTWNDNNEYEIWDRAAQCHGFGTPIDVGLIRPLMPILMTRASDEAQLAHSPQTRPYLISRSGAPGLQRYAQTWSGDNRTEWKTLRYNQRTGLGMSLSGFYNYGHDVGGFAGPKPEPELFLRWIQNGIFHPRFTIHSWNDDGTVNEPWMYPEILPEIRAAFELRYRLLPYLYTCLWSAAHEDEPILRPTFLDHGSDLNCWAESDEFMLGPDLLVATVLDEGVSERSVYLPENGVGWMNFWTGERHEAGTTVDLAVDLSSIPLFVRAGAVIAMSQGAMRAGAVSEAARELHIFAPPAGEDHGRVYEDDGASIDGAYRLSKIEMIATEDAIRLSLSAAGKAPAIATRPVLHGAGDRALFIDGRRWDGGDILL